MANEITLPVGATAEPDTCGSCRFFRRGENSIESYGRCNIVLPPKYATKPYPVRDDELPASHMQDTARCDLHRPDGNVYIVQRVVGRQ